MTLKPFDLNGDGRTVSSPQKEVANSSHITGRPQVLVFKIGRF